MKRLIAILALLISPLAYSQALGGGLFGPASRVRNGTGDPAACTPAGLNVFLNTTTDALKICSATNTWLALATVAGGTFTGPLLAPDGTAAAPAYSFASTGNSDNGMYLSAANAIGLATAGTARWAVNASGALVAATDGGVDIGNGASDPRDVNITRHFATAGLAFASLGTPADGTLTYCTDCTQANPCAGSSTGAFARRENGAWNCGGGAGGSSYTALTAGDLTVTNDGSNGKPFVATWDATLVNTLGAVNAGTKIVATLPANSYIRNMYATVTANAGPGGIGLTVSVGRTGAGYIDYIVESAASGIVAPIRYGDASAERGTNLTGYDSPAIAATTDVIIRFAATGDTLDSVTGSTGSVMIDYMVIP